MNKKYRIQFLMVIWFSLMMSCDSFVDLEVPEHLIVSEMVFDNDETAISAVRGIYNQLSNAAFSNGYNSSVTVLAGMCPDIFETTSLTDTRYGPFQQNQILTEESPSASAQYNLWSSAYNIIYMANSVLEGLSSSTHVTMGTRNILGGQALFLRAFTYFYLTNIYGDVPLVLTTDYRKNALAIRDSTAEVFTQITDDLDKAILLLEDVEGYADSERTNVNLYVALALGARVSLYQQNWEKAEEFSNQVISHTSQFELLEDLNQVFLKNSREAIWQISPLGRGATVTYTWEGYLFRGNNNSPIKLSDSFIEDMGTEDLRFSNWIGFNDNRQFYFPHKYKDASLSSNNVVEYSMVLRLAEQYLIRAEARARLGKIPDAINDVDKIRQRSNLQLISDIDPGIGKEELLNVILEERKFELFSEWGHRWFDLKRTGKASEVLGPMKPFWEDTDVLFPIPQQERLKNPNLTQNAGY